MPTPFLVVLLTLVAAWPAAQAQPVSPQEAVAALQISLDAPLRRAGQPLPPGLPAQMRRDQLPGLSVAVFHAGKLHWAQGFGEARLGLPVTADTRFQAGSISKPVAALAALRFAQAKGIGLDDDLRPGLKSWQPPPEPEGSAPRYTLRRLLSHTAGLGVHGFPGYAVGADKPTTAQVLDGLTPSNTPAVRPVQAANLGFRYSGGGSTVVQQWLEDQTGQPFAAAMQTWVLQPLGMTRSHYEQPPGDAETDPDAYAHAHQGIDKPEPGGWRVYPEGFAAGLWTTPTDLARMLMAVQRARKGEASPLDPAVAAAATTPEHGPVGLGFFLAGSAEAPLRFGHNGTNQGFEATALAYLDRGDGVVLMANSQGSAALFDRVVRTLARVYGWQDLVAPLAVADQTLPPGAAQWQGQYAVPNSKPIRIRHHQQQLWLYGGPGNWQRLWLTDDGSFATETGPRHLRLSGAGLAWGEGAPTMVRQALPSATPRPTIYLRGTMNDWQARQTLRHIGSGRWQLDITLPAGRHSFKLGDADWTAVDLGGRSDAPLGMDTSTELQPGGSNLQLDLPRAGRYRLLLMLPDTPQPARLKLRQLDR